MMRAWLLVMLMALAAVAQEKALLVGIDEYPHHRSLRGPSRDVALMERILVDRYGFPPASIRKLTGTVTREQLLTAFREHLLKGLTPQSTIVFFYAGHGTFVPDPSAIGGFSSGLVPSDAPKDGPGFAASVITSKTIKALADEAAAVTPRVTLIFDSCHSGAMGRKAVGGTESRGLDYPGGPPPPAASPAAGWLDRSKFTVLAAARSSEVALEKRFEDEESLEEEVHGCFTRALTQALLLPRTFTLGELVDYVRLTIESDQVPQLQGSRGQPLFGTGGREPQPYFLVTRVADGTFALNGGSLHRLSPGTEVAIYPAEAQAADPQRWKPLATARLTQVGAFEATAPVPAGSALSQEGRTGYRVFVTRYAYGDQQLRVRLAAPLKALPQKVDGVRVVSKGAADVVVGPGYTLDGRKLSEAELIHQLALRARRKLVLALDNVRGPAADIELTLHAVDPQTRAVQGPLEGELKAGQLFAVRLHNRGTSGRFVTVLDLTPEGPIEVAFPAAGTGEAVGDNSLGAGATYDLLFQAGAQAGEEVFLAVATARALDLTAVGMRGNDDPLQRLLAEAVSGKRGGGPEPQPSTQGWTTTKLRVRVSR